MFEVFILWGQMPEPGDRPTRYTFATEAERDAFMRGVDEANGWIDYRECKNDRPYQPEGDEGEGEGEREGDGD